METERQVAEQKDAAGYENFIHNLTKGIVFPTEEGLKTMIGEWSTFFGTTDIRERVVCAYLEGQAFHGLRLHYKNFHRALEAWEEISKELEAYYGILIPEDQKIRIKAVLRETFSMPNY